MKCLINGQVLAFDGMSYTSSSISLANSGAPSTAQQEERLEA
jgi:hypothetical protein